MTASKSVQDIAREAFDRTMKQAMFLGSRKNATVPSFVVAGPDTGITAILNYFVGYFEGTFHDLCVENLARAPTPEECKATLALLNDLENDTLIHSMAMYYPSGWTPYAMYVPVRLAHTRRFQ